MQALSQRQQMAGKIAAVDGGDIPRQQRCQGLRVVPVEEMSVEALQPVQGTESGSEPLGHRLQAEPAEIAGGQRCKQVQPEVVGELRWARTGAGSS